MTAPQLKAESQAYFRALGIHITELRKQHGMTQAEVARSLQVSQQSVFAYELGDRRVSLIMLIKLAKIFDTPVEQLMRMTPYQGPPRRLSPAGMRHAERFNQLSKKHQRFVTGIIDILLDRQTHRPTT